MSNKQSDVIIIGGSYAGLSAAMALARSLRNVLLIDSNEPCNYQTPYSHNFLTRDGQKPAVISDIAREQILSYRTVQFLRDTVISVSGENNRFIVETLSGQRFNGKKLLLSTGVKDILPPIKGFSACWGISVLHCPYCHGYEVRGLKTGILANGETAFELCKLISNWTSELTLFTNGPSMLTDEQIRILINKNIQIRETPITELSHKEGKLNSVTVDDNHSYPLRVLYARLPFEQPTSFPIQLGCKMTDGLIQTNDFQQTTVSGVYAAGDNSHPMRAISIAVASGTMAGAFINMQLINKAFPHPDEIGSANK